MQVSFTEFLPNQDIHKRTLYIDLIADKAEILHNISQRYLELQNLNAGELELQFKRVPQPISRASESNIRERIAELNGDFSFRTSQLANKCSNDELLTATEGLALQLENAGINFLQQGTIDIKNFGRIEYDTTGKIIKTESTAQIIGLNALEVIAGFCAQDFGLVLQRENSLVYLYGSARFEKTPKHIETGFDYFVGEDFYEWHKRIPQWGPPLARFFTELFLAFQRDKIDMLIVDLKGRNLYTEGTHVVRRYERDYAIPLRSKNAATIGLTVFADSFFKNINDEQRPFFGGKILQIESAREFNTHFKVIKHAAFKHHPFGIREINGQPKSPQ